LSKEELCVACARYYFDVEDTPYKHFYGKYDQVEQIPSGTSTFQIAKLERVYKMKDFNATGTVNEDDFVLWGQKVCEISGIKYTSEKKQNWIKAYKTFFQGDPKNAKEWIGGVLAWQAADPTCIKTSTKVNMALFECIDSGKNGKISWSEFEAFIGALGVSADDAKVAFEMIDANKDGVLSKEELCVACARYYFDVEDTPYKHFYGKYDQVEQIPSD